MRRQRGEPGPVIPLHDFPAIDAALNAEIVYLIARAEDSPRRGQA